MKDKKAAKKLKKPKAEAKPESDEEEKKPAEKKPAEKKPAEKKPKKEKQEGDNKEKKETKGEEKKEFSPAEKEKLTKAALADILENCTKKSTEIGPYVPTAWTTKFKPALGSYKKFCMSQTGTLQVVEKVNLQYLVLKAGAKVPEGSTPTKEKGKSKDWKNMLLGAWSAFCQAMPAGDERLVSTFIAPLPKGVREHGKAVGSPKVSPKMSPKISPAATPASDPAATDGKKRKAEEAEGPKKKKLKKKPKP
jgi:hypothetical protein